MFLCLCRQKIPYQKIGYTWKSELQLRTTMSFKKMTKQATSILINRIIFWIQLSGTSLYVFNIFLINYTITYQFNKKRVKNDRGPGSTPFLYPLFTWIIQILWSIVNISRVDLLPKRWSLLKGLYYWFPVTTYKKQSFFS